MQNYLVIWDWLHTNKSTWLTLPSTTQTLWHRNQAGSFKWPNQQLPNGEHAEEIAYCFCVSRY